MSMKITLEDFLGTDEAPDFSSESIAFKASLDFEADVFRKLQEKNLSQKDLAKLLDISPAAVSKMLTRGANTTIKTMAKIAHALNCVLAPIKLKDANEYSYFDINAPETVSASIELDGKHHTKEKLTINTIQMKGEEAKCVKSASSHNLNSNNNWTKVGGIAA